MEGVDLARLACLGFGGWHLGGVVSCCLHHEPARGHALLAALGFTAAVAVTVLA